MFLTSPVAVSCNSESLEAIRRNDDNWWILLLYESNSGHTAHLWHDHLTWKLKTKIHGKITLSIQQHPVFFFPRICSLANSCGLGWSCDYIRVCSAGSPQLKNKIAVSFGFAKYWKLVTWLFIIFIVRLKFNAFYCYQLLSLLVV